MRSIVGRLVVALALSAMVGCSDNGSSVAEPTATTAPPASTSTSTDGLGSTRVELTAEATTPGAGVVEVEGTATVPDGVRLNWALHPLPKPDMCPVDVPPEDDPCNAPYGQVTVSDEQFRFRVDGVDPGDAELFVGVGPFTDPPQPLVFAERYGDLGERMTGPQVVDTGGGVFRAQLLQTVIVE